VILLGASNLALSFPEVVKTALQIWGEPVEILAAMGHGRSFGEDSRVLGRKISGIFPCALWQALCARPPLPTFALVTDVGNDLMYGVPPDRLLNWVEGCLDRLAGAGASTVLTQLPLASLARLGSARFLLCRALLFPRCKLSLAEVRSRAALVNDGLVALGDVRNIPVIPVSDAWYGLDPIHLKRRVRRRAWPAILAAWRAGAEQFIAPRATVWERAYLAGLAPWEQSILGVRRRCGQPSGRLHDGTTVSLY
jgi:hypothetical protein